MSNHGWAALAILVVAAILFLTRKIRLELVALSIPVALMLTGTITEASVALAGFGNHAVIAIAAVFVLSAGIQESGVAAWLARLVERLGGSSETRILVWVCTVVAILSAFMSNAATVAVMLPVVIAMSRRSGRPASRVLMPLGFAAILGGNLTLIGTSSNLLLSDYLERTTGEPYGMFDFALVGLPICAAGILYLLVFGRRLLPADGQVDAAAMGRGAMPEQLLARYELSGQLVRLRVGKDSTLRNQTLAEGGFGKIYRLSAVAMMRPGTFGERWSQPSPDVRLRKGDELYLEGPEVEAWRLAEATRTRIGLAGGKQVERVLDHGFALAEAIVVPRSSMIGSTLRELNFRRAHGLNVLAIWRDKERLEGDPSTQALEAGDTLLLVGPLHKVRNLQGGDDLLMVAAPRDVRDFRKAPLAVLCLAAALMPPLLGWAPLAMSALGGALLMILTGCLPAERAGRYMDWKVLALIVGTLPMGAALEQHGVADIVAQALVEESSVLGPVLVLGGLFLMSALVSITSSNAAAAVILAPVAARAAMALDMPIAKVLLAVSFGCSCAFIVPFAHQCNLMVQGPGGYRTKDFLRVGGGLSLVVAIVAVGMLAYLAR